MGTLVILNPNPRVTKVGGVWFPPGNTTITEPKADNLRNNFVFQNTLKAGHLRVVSGDPNPKSESAKPASDEGAETVDDTPGVGMSIKKFLPIIKGTLDKEQLSAWLNEEANSDEPRKKITAALEAQIDSLTQPLKEDDESDKSDDKDKE